jgi:hypothetical protein
VGGTLTSTGAATLSGGLSVTGSITATGGTLTANGGVVLGNQETSVVTDTSLAPTLLTLNTTTGAVQRTATIATPYTSFTTNFTQPAVGSTVTVNGVSNTGWMAVGMNVFITGGGYYAVTARAASTVTVRLLAYGVIATPGSGTVSATSAIITPSGAIPNTVGIATSLALTATPTVAQANAFNAGTVFLITSASSNLNAAQIWIERTTPVPPAGSWWIFKNNIAYNFSTVSSNVFIPIHTVANNASSSQIATLGPGYSVTILWDGSNWHNL